MWHRHRGNNQLWRNDNGVWRSQKDQSFVLDLKHDGGYGKNYFHHPSIEYIVMMVGLFCTPPFDKANGTPVL